MLAWLSAWRESLSHCTGTLEQMSRPNYEDVPAGPLGWLETRLRPIGERIGEAAFDTFCRKKNSPTIQKQKEPYSNTMGKAFFSYILAVVIIPLGYAVSGASGSLFPNTPDTLFWDLQTTTPPLPYGVYGTSLINLASIYLAGRLFNNFLTDDMEQGETLALAHAAVLFLITGSAFQAGAAYENHLSPPADSSPAVFDFVYFAFENLGLVMPYLTMFVLAGFAVIAYLFIGVQHDTTQTEITADRWEQADGAHSSVENESE